MVNLVNGVIFLKIIFYVDSFKILIFKIFKKNIHGRLYFLSNLPKEPDL